MNVIRRLRRKFILISTTTVIIIVVGVLGLVNTIAYMRVYTHIESNLMYLAQNNKNLMPKEMLQNSNSLFGEIDWSENTPDFPYQIRFFSLLMEENGKIKELNLKNIAAFTEKEAIEYASFVLNSGRTTGFFKKDRATYAFLITENKNNDVAIVIMDCTPDISIVEDFMRVSITLGCLSTLLYVIILAILSNFAIKPFVRNVENQKRFITNAGHELKTPIAIISANTEAMELINGKNQWTESILKQVRRLSKMINDLIILAKVGEKTESEIIFTKINFSEIAIEVVKSFEQMAIEQKKQLEYKIEPDVFIKSEGKCLYELINILVDNAVKYCDDGGSVQTELITKKKEVILSVSNNYADGKNVDYSRFFERFYRGDISHSSEKAGYGIGLSIANELVQLLKGKIQVKYIDGRIIFTIKFNL